MRKQVKYILYKKHPIVEDSKQMFGWCNQPDWVKKSEITAIDGGEITIVFEFECADKEKVSKLFSPVKDISTLIEVAKQNFSAA